MQAWQRTEENGNEMDRETTAGDRYQKPEPLSICGSRKWKDSGAGGADHPDDQWGRASAGSGSASGDDIYQCGGGRDAGTDRGGY